MMSIDWQTFAALIGSFTGMATLFVVVTRAIVREEVRKLNGTYMRRELADERFGNIDMRIKELRDYAHSARHDMANILMKVQGVKD